jgi:hypothetical protein
MVGHRTALRLVPGGMGDVTAPVPAASVTCWACGMADPPPDPACSAGPERIDHRVGTAAGCPHCGRLREACARRPCFGSPPKAATTTAQLVRLSRLAQRLVIRPGASRAER